MDCGLFVWGRDCAEPADEARFTFRPVDLPLSRPAAVAVGPNHTAAIDAEGRLFTWGRGAMGLLGLGVMNHRHEEAPQQVKTLSHCRVAQVACSELHSACVDNEGRLFTWGWGNDGRLGQGTMSSVPQPMMVRALQEHVIVRVALGYYHSAALTHEGLAFTWGGGQGHRLGHGSERHEREPRLLEGLRGVTAITCGCCHTAALAQGGTGPPC